MLIIDLEKRKTLKTVAAALVGVLMPRCDASQGCYNPSCPDPAKKGAAPSPTQRPTEREDSGPSGAGCMLRGLGAQGGSEGSYKILPSLGIPYADQGLKIEYPALRLLFQVQPAFGIFDDSSSPNAFATPEHVVSGQSSPDGSVVLGVTLAHKIWESFSDEYLASSALIGVLAHEFTHILQFRTNAPHGQSAMPTELMADYMAGWYIATKCNRQLTPQAVFKEMFDIGDTHFTSPSHHGTPQQRYQAVTAGYMLATNTPGYCNMQPAVLNQRLRIAYQQAWNTFLS